MNKDGAYAMILIDQHHQNLLAILLTRMQQNCPNKSFPFSTFIREISCLDEFFFSL